MLRVSLLWIFFFIGSAVGSKIPTAVLDLNEKFLDVMNNGYWFVKFYAPWCAHCKRLAPTWEHMAHALADTNPQIRVGKVDCTRFPSVASSLGITGYPTVIFFRKGVRIPYEGERKKKNMMEFAEKTAGPVIQNLTTLSRFYELKKASGVDPFFVYIKNTEMPLSIRTITELDDADDEEYGAAPKTLYDLYSSIAEELFTEVRFFTASPDFFANVKDFKLPEAQRLGTDSIISVKDRRFTFFDISFPDKLRRWIEAERWPLLPQISASNIYSIANSAQKKLVIMAGDATEMITRNNMSSDTGQFYHMFKKAANFSYYDDLLSEKFQYGWTDEVALIRSVIMGELTLPNVVVLNLSSYEFYLNDDHPSQITEFSMQTFLQRVAANNVTAHGGRAWPTRFRRMLFEITSNIHDMFYHQPILTVCLFGVPLAFFSIIFYSVCSADFSVDRNEIYPDDENDDYDYAQSEDAYTGEVNEVERPEDNNDKLDVDSAWDEEDDAAAAADDENDADGQTSADSETELIRRKNTSRKKSD